LHSQVCSTSGLSTCNASHICLSSALCCSSCGQVRHAAINTIKARKQTHSQCPTPAYAGSDNLALKASRANLRVRRALPGDSYVVSIDMEMDLEPSSLQQRAWLVRQPSTPKARQQGRALKADCRCAARDQSALLGRLDEDAVLQLELGAAAQLLDAATG
jgi:hypothetical protein